VFSAAGLPRPDISVLSAEFLAEVAGMEHKNLAVALLERILRDQIRLRRKESVIQARSFEELLDRALQKYLHRSIEVAQVIQELIELAVKFAKDGEKAQELGLSREEFRFYEALADNKSAQDVLGDTILSQMAHELTKVVRKNASIDWDRKKNVQAKLRLEVKKLLKRYKYPPDAEASAIETVLEQARTLGINIVEGAPSSPPDAIDDTNGGDEQATHELPYPLAVFEQLVLSHESKALRVKTMVDAVERALAFTVICALARLRELNGGNYSEAVLEALGKDVGKPIAMGTWLSYAQSLPKLLQADDNDPVARAARVFVDGAGKPSPLAQQIGAEVVPYRNTFSHGVTTDEVQVLRHEESIKRAWTALLKALAPFRATELVSMAEILGFGKGDEVRYKVRIHQGSQSIFPVVEKALKAQLDQRWAYLLRVGKPPLSLAPFLVYDCVKEKDARELLIARTIALKPGGKVDMVGVASTSKAKLEAP
jgi:type I restriction enzyme R subunit